MGLHYPVNRSFPKKRSFRLQRGGGIILRVTISGLYWGYIGIMEKKMDTTFVGYIGYILGGTTTWRFRGSLMPGRKAVPECTYICLTHARAHHYPSASSRRLAELVWPRGPMLPTSVAQRGLKNSCKSAFNAIPDGTLRGAWRFRASIIQI